MVKTTIMLLFSVFHHLSPRETNCFTLMFDLQLLLMLHPTACFDPLNHVLGQVQITLRRMVYFRGSFVVVWSKDAVWKFILTAFGQHHCSLPGFCTLGHLSTLMFEVHKHIPATYRWIPIRHLFCGTSCQIWEIETLLKKIRLKFFLFLK